jgi:hypothetical protein
MQRHLTALVLTATLGASLPAAAQTISITVEGNATITIEQAEPTTPGAQIQRAKPLMPRMPKPQRWHGGAAEETPYHPFLDHHGLPVHPHHTPNIQQQETLEGILRGPDLRDLLERYADEAGPMGRPAQRLEQMQPHHWPQRPAQPMDDLQPLWDDGITVEALPDIEPAPVRCDPKVLEGLIGSTLPVASQLTQMGLGTSVRILTAGQPYTLDRRTDRASLVVDGDRVVRDAYCG